MKNKKTIIAIISVVAVILVLIGVTYAYWLVTKEQQGENVISSACLDISLNGSGDINLPNQYPMSDEDGMETTPYTFTITNNCTTSIEFHLNLESIGESATAISASAIKAAINTNKPKRLYEYVGAEPTLSEAYESYTLLYGELAGKSDDTTEDEVTYNLRLWIDKDAPISEANKTFTSKITVSVGQNIKSFGSTLATLIKAYNQTVTTEQTFATVSTDASEKIYQTQDDFGTAYYFRGNPTNNYVKLGKWEESLHVYVIEGPNDVFTSLTECNAALNEFYSGQGLSCKEYFSVAENSDMYWRILRINGDGTIRLVYDGISAESSENDKPLVMYGKYSENYDNPKYFGFTYDENGAQVDNKSKIILQNWYRTHLKEEYGKYIADGVFCNDTSNANGDEYYDVYDRVVTNKQPILICTQAKDKYTVSQSVGNGLLSEPIGLASADEVLMAGNYIYTGTSAINNYYGYLTMSPYAFGYNGGNSALILGYMPSEIQTNGPVSQPGQYRPVINIKANTLFTGSGKTTDPFVLAIEA